MGFQSMAIIVIAEAAAPRVALRGPTTIIVAIFGK